MNLDDAIAEVARARRRLADDQGRLARKNARAALKNAIGTALRAMDREYPLIRKERVVRVAMTPLAKKRREKRRLMEHTVATAAVAATLAACGVRVAQPDGGRSGLWMVPAWAYRALGAKISADEIGRAVRSRSVRNRIEALLRLQNGTSKVT